MYFFLSEVLQLLLRLHYWKSSWRTGTRARILATANIWLF